MSAIAGDLSPASNLSGWRTPLIIACGCAIALLESLLALVNSEVRARSRSEPLRELPNWSASAAVQKSASFVPRLRHADF